MRLFTICLLGAMTGGSAAVACPEVNVPSSVLTYEAGQLASAQTISLTAGGENRLEACGLGALGFGQFRSQADHTFFLQGELPEGLTLAVTSECDTTMLVNTADRQWHFNDDGNDNLDPRIEIPAGAALDGQIDVWVGTFAGGDCPASLNIAQTGVEMPPMLLGATTVAPQAVTPQPIVPQPAPAPLPVQTPVPAPMPVPAPTPVPVAICPNPNMVGPSLNLTGPQLLAAQAYQAQIGGQHSIDDCPGIGGWGTANEAPSFTLYMSQMNGYMFTVETTSNCDPTMILRDAYGQWHFNDDGPNGLQPQLQIDGSALNGRVDIWVGSFGGNACPGTIVFRTAATAPPMPPAGCPNPALQGPLINTTGSALYSPTDYSVMAGGSTELSTCGLPVFGRGYFSPQPSYTFMLSGMQEYGRLEIEGSSSCDTVMLVRTPDGMWHFDDDSNGNLDPLINLTNTMMLNGRLDVWVGTYGGSNCAATIEMETWHS